MKKHSIIVLVTWCMVLWALGMVAGTLAADATAELPHFDVNTAPLPSSLEAYWQFAIAAVTPFITAFFKWLAPKTPRKLWSVVPPLTGIVIGLILQAAGAQHLPWWHAGLAGLLGGLAATGAREAFDQQIVQPNTPPEVKIAELNATIAEVGKNPKATT